MPKLTVVRRECSDGRTCPAVAVPDEGDDRWIIGRLVTDPAELAQLDIGPGEVAVTVPGSLLPEVTGER